MADKLGIQIVDKIRQISGIIGNYEKSEKEKVDKKEKSKEEKEREELEKKIKEKEDESEDKDSKVVKITELEEEKPEEVIETTPIIKDKVEPEVKQEVIIGDGFSLELSEIYPNLLELKDRDQNTGIFVEQIVEDIGEAEKVFRYQEKLGLIKPEVKKEVSRMELKLSYIPGKTLDTSFLVGNYGDQEHQVAISDFVPLMVQNAILEKNSNVLSPDEILEQVSERCSDLYSFKRFMKKRVKRVESEKQELEAKKKEEDEELKEKEKKEKEKKEKANLEAKTKEEKEEEEKEKAKKKVKSDDIKARIKSNLRVKSQILDKPVQSLNPAEIEDVKSVADLQIAMDKTETNKEKAKLPTGGPGDKVRKYFGRLPGGGLGDHQKALKPGEAASKIKELQTKLAEKDKVLKEKETELDSEKLKAEKQEKGQLIYDIVSTMKQSEQISAEKEEELISMLGTLENSRLEDIKKVLVFNSGQVIDSEDEVTETDGNIAHVIESITENEDAVTKLSKIMNMK